VKRVSTLLAKVQKYTATGTFTSRKAVLKEEANKTIVESAD